MLTYLLFTSTGFFAWGQSSYAQDPWPVPVIVCLGMINFGVQLGTTGVVTYIVDCHREKAGEAFATMNFLKNLFAFGLSFYLNGWIDSQGVRNCFFTIGGITMAAALCTIPMWVSPCTDNKLMPCTNILFALGISSENEPEAGCTDTALPIDYKEPKLLIGCESVLKLLLALYRSH